MIGIGHYLTLSAILLCTGLFGILARRNAIALLLAIELILQGAGLSFVTFSRYQGSINGQIFTIFIIILAAGEAIVGLSIILAIYRIIHRIDLDEMKRLKG